MKTADARTYRRLNITLPQETVQLIDRVTAKANRSRFINDAVRHYVGSVGRKQLRERIRQGAVRHAERDLSMVEEWFAADAEAWPGRSKT
jgi:CopG family transcriptional regulator/antitoxin EndoAI